jgi:transcriptional regulator with XRE-family HTH domain
MFELPPTGTAGVHGVIDMELLSVIRRWAFRDKLSIREVSRRTGLSRNTIRKYLRSGSIEPSFRTPDRPSKLDAFADKLSAWLRTEASKSRKQKRTLNPTVSLNLLNRPLARAAAAWASRQDMKQSLCEADTQRCDGVRHVAL